MHAVLATLRQEILRRFPILDRHQSIRQFVKFCIIGVTNVVIDVGIYLWLTRIIGWYFILASTCSFIVAVSWSFYWNRRWTFRLPGQAGSGQFAKFVITNASSGLFQIGVLYLAVEVLHWYDLIGKAIVIVLGTFWNFTLTKFWAFRE